MKVMLLGKPGRMIHWVEDIAADLRLAGHAVTVAPTRDIRLHKSLERALLSPVLGAPLARRLVRAMRRLRPDLILTVGRLEELPPSIFGPLGQAPNRPPMVAWIGDTFTERASEIANLFDLIAYTDSGLVEAHAKSGFRSASAFVPLGASRVAVAANAKTARIPALAFVAVPTPNRRELLARVTDPVAVYGPGWQHASELTRHRRDARRIAEPELATIYASHLGVLNIRHATNVIHGLNHRHFAPYVQATAVVTDAQPDIPYCFDAGTEMLIYHDADELNCLYAALRRDPAKALAVGSAGRRRVLACHTYAHRLASMAALVGVKPT